MVIMYLVVQAGNIRSCPRGHRVSSWFKRSKRNNNNNSNKRPNMNVKFCQFHKYNLTQINSNYCKIKRSLLKLNLN